MTFKKPPFSFFNKDRRKMNYIKSVYKRRVQAEIESYKDCANEGKKATINDQDILMLERTST